MRTAQLERIVLFGLMAVFLSLIIGVITDVISFRFATANIESALHIFAHPGVGALAGILAIVISLTLMAVQFASQEYSHRIMGAYIKSTTFWSLIGVYTFAILYNVYAIGSVGETVEPKVVEVSMLLTTLCLILLIPHFVFTMAHLRPNFIISEIFRTMDSKYLDSIKKYSQGGRLVVPSEEDRLLPAIETIEKSIKKGDRTTTRTALDELYDYYSNLASDAPEEYKRQYFMDYMLRIGREAILSVDDDSVVQILEMLGRAGSSSPSKLVVEHTQMLGIGALKRDYDAAVQQMIDSLGLMLAAVPDEEVMDRIYQVFSDLSDELFSVRKSRMLQYLIDGVAGLTETIVHTGNKLMLNRSIEVLERVGRNAATSDMRDVLRSSIQAFHKIGVAVVRQELATSDDLVRPLLRIEYDTNQKNRDIIGEIQYITKEIERDARPQASSEAEGGIDTSDLWQEPDD